MEMIKNKAGFWNIELEKLCEGFQIKIFYILNTEKNVSTKSSLLFIF